MRYFHLITWWTLIYLISAEFDNRHECDSQGEIDGLKDRIENYLWNAD